MEMLCIVIGWLIGSTIYQRLKWWLSKKYYQRKFKKTEGDYATFVYFSNFELMIRTSASIIKRGGVFISYQEIDFARTPYRVIFRINANTFEKE